MALEHAPVPQSLVCSTGGEDGAIRTQGRADDWEVGVWLIPLVYFGEPVLVLTLLGVDLPQFDLIVQAIVSRKQLLASKLVREAQLVVVQLGLPPQ